MTSVLFFWFRICFRTIAEMRDRTRIATPYGQFWIQKRGCRWRKRSRTVPPPNAVIMATEYTPTISIFSRRASKMPVMLKASTPRTSMSFRKSS